MICRTVSQQFHNFTSYSTTEWPNSFHLECYVVYKYKLSSAIHFEEIEVGISLCKYYILGITKNFLVALVCTRPLCISSRYRALSWGPFRFSVPHLTKAKMCRILFFFITQHSDWNIHKALIDTFLVVVWLTRKTVKLSVDIWHELSCHAIPSCKCIWGCLLVQIRLQNCISKAGDHHHHF